MMKLTTKIVSLSYLIILCDFVLIKFVTLFRQFLAFSK
jgi:hypothetical protein